MEEFGHPINTTTTHNYLTNTNHILRTILDAIAQTKDALLRKSIPTFRPT